MTRATAMEIICSLLVLLFLYTGLSKLLNFQVFAGDMRNQPFPSWLANSLPYILPPAEIILSAMLCFTATRQAGLWGSLILMLLFTAYTALVLLHAFSRVPCGCGGIIRRLSWPQHLALNIFYTALCILGLRYFTAMKRGMPKTHKSRR